MRFLLNWARFLGGSIISLFVKPRKGKIIPDRIDDLELVVRGIFTPYYYSVSKNELKEGAFLPPPKQYGNGEVSVLRHNFTTDNFCKNHCLKINIAGAKFSGLATFLAIHINELTQKHKINNEVYLKFSPLQVDLRTEIVERPVLDSFPGIPMHADLFYDVDFEPGKPQTKYRKFAKELATSISNYFHDLYPDNENWLGEKLKWIPKT